ncbi:UvrD-helicase domain-containing protein [Ampullimonas aquatilis]|uniref:UvrD-helicase domain-containing protein n=1 Tax=Ampullimonas aquatilis TaxID=1341549 RepID=UPI003C73EC43
MTAADQPGLPPSSNPPLEQAHAQPQLHPYAVNGAGAPYAQFLALACDPARSVVIEACAGSGKTWLLVSRLFRLLLAGVRPNEILAITFTRKAAQEMRERLYERLAELASAPAARALDMLIETGVAPADAPALLGPARQLYVQVLAAPNGMTVSTFHGWFTSLLKAAPVSAGLPQGFAMQEKISRLVNPAWRNFLQKVQTEPITRAAFGWLLNTLGEFNTRDLLLNQLHHRAEWQLWLQAQPPIPAALAVPTPVLDELGLSFNTLPAASQHAVQALAQQFGEVVQGDPITRLMHDQTFKAQCYRFTSQLGQGSEANQRNAAKLEQAITAFFVDGELSEFKMLYKGFCTTENEPKQFKGNKDLTKNLGSATLEILVNLHVELAERLLAVQAATAERQTFLINVACWLASQTLQAGYAQEKLARRELDFADLEAHAHRLMQDEAWGAYFQTRLDARYRHILLDEFQDTNPMQWAVMAGWLDSYAWQGLQPPSLFVVGDPKQSIYRFRGAEPRLFEVVRSWMQSHLNAVHLRTNHTRRNSPLVLNALNRGFAQIGPRYALYQPQSTQQAEQPGLLQLLAVSLPATDKTASADTALNPQEQAALQWRDPFTQAQIEQESEPQRLARAEGQALVAAVQSARAQLGCRWRDVLLLARGRQRFAIYEACFAAAGIPFVSDRSGGLLSTLEAGDLEALLTFLTTPEANLALAQTLKSPFFAVSDQALYAVARAVQQTANQINNEASNQTSTVAAWWHMLLSQQNLLGEQGAAIVAQLSHWQTLAASLPVHDLLDAIYHQGQVRERYAAAAPLVQRARVVANLDAFLNLALDLDAGRYPSVPRFLTELHALRRLDEREAPNEGDTSDQAGEGEMADVGNEAGNDLTEANDQSLDAVRMMTIHAAKGLEADIVLLADANGSLKADVKPYASLVDWPAGTAAPVAAFMLPNASGRGLAMQDLLEQQNLLGQTEHFNLLYVAMTRARQSLIVSGTIGTKEIAKAAKEASKDTNNAANAEANNIANNDSLDHLIQPASTNNDSDEQAAHQHILRALISKDSWLGGLCRAMPEALMMVNQTTPVPEPVQANSASTNSAAMSYQLIEFRPTPVEVRECTAVRFSNAQTDWGTSVHAALEMLAPQSRRTGLSFNTELAADAAALQVARELIAQPHLQAFFDPQHYVSAYNELELASSTGELLRIDRLVETSDAIWVLDYKLASQDDAALLKERHSAQLQKYVAVLQSLSASNPVGNPKPVKAAIVTYDGKFVEV